MTVERVYVVMGCFGDQQWIEGEWTGDRDPTWTLRAYRTRQEATGQMERLWETRESESPEAPGWAQKLVKFDVAELTLQ